MPLSLGQRAILPCLAVVVNGCAQMAREAVPPEIARHAPLAPMYAHRFPLGAAVEPRHLQGADGHLLAWHFNAVVAENAMKPPRLQPAEGQFDFTAADRIVAFAEERGMKIRGHTLLWHEETPDWFWRAPDGGPATGERVLERLRAHIHAVVGRYRGRVHAWDVVNEVVDPAAPGCLRNDRWLQVVGPRYVEAAFRYAHEADPGARLFVNDFETTQPTKRDCLLGLARDLRARGVPVHGMGHQMHVDVDRPSVREVDETLAAFAALGLDNHVTELDMSLGPAPRQAPGGEAALLARQAARYGEFFRVFAARPDVKAVTLWGLSDADTWLIRGARQGSGDKPLLFDADRQPKAAYREVAGAAR